MSQSNSPCFEFIHRVLGEDLVGVEIGIWEGGNAEAVLDYIHPKKYYMIDPYIEYSENNFKQLEFDSIYNRMYSKFNKIPGVIILRKTSIEAASIVEDNLDFVYIDGAHNYENKIIDLRTWYLKVRNGGILCGDDYIIPSVIKAVDDFAKERNLIFEISKDCLPHPPEYWTIKRED